MELRRVHHMTLNCRDIDNTLQRYFAVSFLFIYHSREQELEHGADLTASYVNTSVDLKFFPDSPVERDVANRVR